jgi:hypothetical protein
MRSRLQRFGVNLNDQTKNQRLALEGSVTGLLATIDLSMASDTVSRTLVELLLDSSPWLPYLGQSRSPFGVLPSGEKIFYQKFSSMGNGYTFELETVIFWSLAQAYAQVYGAEERQIMAYGDDLVVPCDMAEGFMKLLEYVGFKPNAKKSFWSGPFRESCGKHYLCGYDVTPFYVKKVPTTLLDLFKIHNQIWRFIARSEWLDEGQIDQLLGVCRWLRGFAPAKWRKPMIIDGIGDGAFVGHFDEVLPCRSREGWDGWLFKSFISIPVHAESHDSAGLLVKSLVGMDKPPTSGIRLLLDDPGKKIRDKSCVFPTVGTKAVPGEIFVPSPMARRLATGPFY